MRSLVFGVAACVAASSAAAQTQDRPPVDEPAIVVTGQKEIPPAVAREYVGSISSSVEGQLSRFTGPVCPVVIGLPDEYANVVAKRISLVAEEAGADAPKGRCSPNIVVLIAHDADALVKDMRKSLPGLFNGVRDTDMARALRDGPVHVWSTIETQNEDGRVAGGGSTDKAASTAPTLQVRSVSLINASVQQAVMQSVVVLDSQALIDKSLTQIADYVAMRTLAGARPPKQGVEADTILTLFDPGAVAPPQLTAVDRSFVTGIYRMRPLSRAGMQRSAIAKQITRDAKERAGTN